MLPSGKLLRRIAALLGTTLRDAETGEVLGKALVFAWRGRVHVLGYTGHIPLRLIVVSRQKLEYWRLSVAFTAAREPNYPRMESPPEVSDSVL